MRRAGLQISGHTHNLADLKDWAVASNPSSPAVPCNMRTGCEGLHNITPHPYTKIHHSPFQWVTHNIPSTLLYIAKIKPSFV